MNIPQFREKRIEWVNKQPGEMLGTKTNDSKGSP